jgi:hypothetical protein
MVTMGYGGGYAAAGPGCDCAGGGAVMSAPSTVVSPGTVMPTPMGDQAN